MINWQIPEFKDRSLLKKQSVGHCVHMLRSLSEKRIGDIMKWIKIQRSIGIAQIRIYVIEDHRRLAQQILPINLEMKREFVQIVEYNTSFSSRTISIFTKIRQRF